MFDLSLLDEYYKSFAKDLTFWIPEGIYFIDLNLLHQFDLLHFHPTEEHKNPILSRSFHVIEFPDKVTLLNEQFVIWITPYKIDDISITSTLIALNSNNREPQLEVAFIASGIYNTSKLILKVLEKFLTEIEETETTLLEMQEENG